MEFPKLEVPKYLGFFNYHNKTLQGWPIIGGARAIYLGVSIL